MKRLLCLIRINYLLVFPRCSLQLQSGMADTDGGTSSALGHSTGQVWLGLLLPLHQMALGGGTPTTRGPGQVLPWATGRKVRSERQMILHSAPFTYGLSSELRSGMGHTERWIQWSTQESWIHTNIRIGFCLITATTETEVPAVNLQTYPGKDWDKRSSRNECSEVSKQF